MNTLRNVLLFFVAAWCGFATLSARGKQAAHKPILPSSEHRQNKAPLLQKPLLELNLGEVRADGWLKQQLERMRDGLTGHLDEIYPQVMGPRNGWLGGDGDVWERGPYWIDGLLPLAYILNDAQLKEKVQPWIEWALASQREDGYFGPSEDRPNEPGLQRNNAQDWWPKMVVLKIMQQYYTATGDERVIPFMTRYFQYQLRELPKHNLGHWTFWGERRGGDNLMMVYWLYNITGEKFLLNLGELIHKQTHDWTGVFLHGDHLSRQHSLHCVNLGQGFKELAVYYQYDKDAQHIRALDKAVKDMRNTIGLPTGLWGGDERLRFGDPTCGSELCTAVEMMYSLEAITEITGDMRWADHLERVAYNALPTQANDDYTARQYYQQVNQVACTRAVRQFSTPHTDTDILFGVLNGYACCTSNMHQGWPKLTQHLWYATPDEGLAAVAYAPSSVSTAVAGGKRVCIQEETAYPFDETVTFHFSFEDKKQKELTFPFRCRIPGWCKHAKITLNGQMLSVGAKAGTLATIERTWKAGDVLTVEFPADVQVSYWYGGSAAIERGPLVYALKLQETWKQHDFKESEHIAYGKKYWEVTTESPWNYALKKDVLRQAESIQKDFEVVKHTTQEYPWNVDNAPITLRTRGLRLPEWHMYNGSTGPIAYYNQERARQDEGEPIELIPYGCTTLRIAAFPVR